MLKFEGDRTERERGRGGKKERERRKRERYRFEKKCETYYFLSNNENM